MALIHIPDLWRERVLAAVNQRKGEFFRDDPGGSLVDFYKELPPLFHETWVTSIFEPAVPELSNTDGESMAVTRVSFHATSARSCGCSTPPKPMASPSATTARGHGRGTARRAT